MSKERAKDAKMSGAGYACVWRSWELCPYIDSQNPDCFMFCGAVKIHSGSAA